MASPEWLEIFRSYSPTELAAQITKLKSQVSVFTSQAVGNKNYTKDLAELRGQLSAAVRIQNERAAAGKPNPYIGVTNFSNINSQCRGNGYP